MTWNYRWCTFAFEEYNSTHYRFNILADKTPQRIKISIPAGSAKDDGNFSTSSGFTRIQHIEPVTAAEKIVGWWTFDQESNQTWETDETNDQRNGSLNSELFDSPLASSVFEDQSGGDRPFFFYGSNLKSKFIRCIFRNGWRFKFRENWNYLTVTIAKSTFRSHSIQLAARLVAFLMETARTIRKQRDGQFSVGEVGFLAAVALAGHWIYEMEAVLPYFAI